MNRIREIRKSKKITQEALGEAIGYNQSAVSKIESGDLELSVDLAMQIAEFLGEPLGSLLPPNRPVAVAGTVGAGAKVPLVDNYEKGDGLYHVACPAILPQSGGIVGVEVDGDSMSPIYYNGDILFYTRVTVGVPTEAVGVVCVCEDANGDAWVKQVKNGSEPGKFHLISINPQAENMFDMKLKWAAPVRLHLPKDLVERV